MIVRQLPTAAFNREEYIDSCEHMDSSMQILTLIQTCIRLAKPVVNFTSKASETATTDALVAILGDVRVVACTII